eukprot:m.490342 g.490342  ORF g.490342 m.490342 type:complete len:493 (-) comp27843_c0_seq1:147-1625(-)
MAAHALNRTPAATVDWMHENFEACEGGSLGRETLYKHYCDHCSGIGSEPVNQASFGKIIRSVFPGLKTRRLGTRGNSKYHYYGIKLQDNSTLFFSPDQIGGAHNRYRTGGKKTKKPKSEPSAAAANEPVIPAQYVRTPVLAAFPGSDPFCSAYNTHCQEALRAICAAEFEVVRTLWTQFWGTAVKIYTSLLNSDEGMQLVSQCDEKFWAAVEFALVVDPLCRVPESLIKEIRQFAKTMESVHVDAMQGLSEAFVLCRTTRIRALAKVIRRYTSLNHLAQAARTVVANAEQVGQMFKDVNCVDFRAVQAQVQIVFDCQTATLQQLEAEFKQGLEKRNTLELWAGWLQQVAKRYVLRHADHAAAAKGFQTRWCFCSSLVIRDLTLRSATSFGSFHLMRLLFDEYVMFMVEEIGTKGIAVLDNQPGSQRIPPLPAATVAAATAAAAAAAAAAVVNGSAAPQPAPTMSNAAPSISSIMPPATNHATAAPSVGAGET